MKEEEKEGVLLVAGMVLAVLILLGVGLSGGLFMWVAGIINGYWAAFPAFTFFESVAIVVLLGVLGGLVRGRK